MANVLRITDGTSTVNLLGLTEGYDIDGWRQPIAGYKAGGVWQQSSLSEGRRLVSREFDNVVEAFPVTVVAGASPNAAICALQDLIALCEKAADYWTTDWQDEPVWIEAQADCETYMRYTVVYRGRVPDIPDIFDPDFSFSAALADLTLEVEHGPWLGNQPGEATETAASAVETYDGRNLGNVDTGGNREPVTDPHVYVVNRRQVANITDVYWYSNTSGWSSNLMDATLPTALFDTSQTVGDSVYFGIDTSIAHSGPFCNLVFDLSQAFDGSLSWNYSHGAGFSSLTTSGGTSQLGTTGVCEEAWVPHSAWAPLNLLSHFGGGAPNITGYWVEAVIGSTGTQVPIQNNRRVYAAAWPYVDIDIDGSAIQGQLPALAKWRLYGEYQYIERVIVGLRTYNRGSSFTAYVNLADEQNPSIITVTASKGSFVNDIEAPSGRAWQYAPGASTGWEQAVDWSVNDNQSRPDWYGTYRLFMRAKQTGGSVGDVKMYVEVSMDLGGRDTREVEFATVGQLQLLDFGTVTIPPAELYTADYPALVQLKLRTDFDAAVTLTAYDMILIPVDEWAGIVYYPDPDVGLIYTTRSMLVDSATVPKAFVRALSIEDNATESLVRTRGTAIILANGPAILQAGKRQRLWFLFVTTPGTNDLRPYTYSLCSFEIDRVQRYLGPRGNR